MENLLALAAGMALATWAVHHWLEEEKRVCGLWSGGTQVVPPGTTGG